MVSSGASKEHPKMRFSPAAQVVRQTLLKKARFSSSNLSSSANLFASKALSAPTALFGIAPCLKLDFLVPLATHASTSLPKQYPTRDNTKAYSGIDGGRVSRIMLVG